MSPSTLFHTFCDTSRPRTLDAEAPRNFAGPFCSWGGESGFVACAQKAISSIELPVTFLHERLCQQHIVMVTFVLGSKQTNICIEFKELQGGVRATSILCLLGIGLGVGSVLLYKLCTKILSPAISAARGKRRTKSPEELLQERQLKAILSPDTPDSGISTGTTLTQAISSCALSPDSHLSDDVSFSQKSLRQRSVYQTPLQQISSPRRPSGFGSQGSSDSLPYDSVYTKGHGGEEWPRQREHRTFSSSATSDQGFFSGNLLSRDGMWHKDQSDVPFENSDRSFSPVPGPSHRPDTHFHGQDPSFCDAELSSDSYATHSRQAAFHSTPQTDHVFDALGEHYTSFAPSLRRNTHSMGSDLSQYSDLSMRESLVSKGYSIDCGESLSQLGASTGRMFDSDSIAPSSASNMDVLQREIRIIREEISEMNDKVHLLSSRENLQDIFMLTPDPMNDTEFNQSKVLRRKRPLPRDRSLSESRSCSVSVDGDPEDSTTWRRSYHHTGEFIWDYQSDLAVEDTANFVANRPMIGDSAAMNADKIDYDSPTFDHVRKYIESCCDVQYDISEKGSPSVIRKNPNKSRTFSSITDMYIDDNYSEFGETTNFEERNGPEGCHSTETPNCQSENGNSPKFVQKVLDNDLRKQLSFSNSVDCDSNGNPGLPETSADKNDKENTDVMNRSMCKECGSPSHRTKRLDSPLLDRSSGDNILRQVCSPRSLNSCGSEASHPHKRRRWEVKNINNKVNLFEYAEREVKGDQPASKVVKKGFHQIRGLLGMSYLRPIRGDNYCALRATLFQICTNKYPVLQHLGSLDTVLRKLSLFDDPQYSFLHNWNFANRLPYTKDSVVERIQECVICFYKHVEALCAIPSTSEREAAFLEFVNFDPDVDLQMLEAVKVLMMVEAASLYEAYCGLGHQKAPAFTWLVYSRQSSENPEALFNNHINCLGDVTSAQQVELYLLGHTLGVKIEVIRPACYGQEDFISHYPDDGADGFPKVFLVAENNRHYHAVMH